MYSEAAPERDASVLFAFDACACRMTARPTQRSSSPPRVAMGGHLACSSGATSGAPRCSRPSSSVIATTPTISCRTHSRSCIAMRPGTTPLDRSRRGSTPSCVASLQITARGRRAGPGCCISGDQSCGRNRNPMNTRSSQHASMPKLPVAPWSSFHQCSAPASSSLRSAASQLPTLRRCTISPNRLCGSTCFALVRYCAPRSAVWRIRR
jgi:hypothetical protein